MHVCTVALLYSTVQSTVVRTTVMSKVRTLNYYHEKRGFCLSEILPTPINAASRELHKNFVATPCMLHSPSLNFVHV